MGNVVCAVRQTNNLVGTYLQKKRFGRQCRSSQPDKPQKFSIYCLAAFALFACLSALACFFFSCSCFLNCTSSDSAPTKDTTTKALGQKTNLFQMFPLPSSFTRTSSISWTKSSGKTARKDGNSATNKSECAQAGLVGNCRTKTS